MFDSMRQQKHVHQFNLVSSETIFTGYSGELMDGFPIDSEEYTVTRFTQTGFHFSNRATSI